MTSLERGEAVTMIVTNVYGDTVAREQTTKRFHFRVDHNEPFVVSFAQPGSITKDVVVDTSHLPPLRRDARVKHLRFDVVMEPGDPGHRSRYARPVGYVRFRPQAGSVEVIYDHEPEAVSDMP